jgi:L-ornithine N5-monooxygenase
VYEVVCVGFGPANIALAVALEELWPTARVKFLEKEAGPCWQPGMLLDGSDIQNDPRRDLVTPRNPRSRFTFVNFLHETGQLFRHLNLPAHFPLRKEYARYIRWVAEHVSADVDYGQEANRISLVAADATGDQRAVEVSTRGGTYRGQALVLAPGRAPYVPAPFAAIQDPRMFHTSRYLDGIADLEAGWAGTLAVVGASQSAIEVVLDLIARFPRARVVNVMSGFGYRLKDTSPFSEEVYFPEFVDYYYRASAAGRQRLRDQLRPTNYSSADRDVIDALYLRMYEDELDGRPRVTLRTNRLITAAAADDDGVTLDLTECITTEQERLTVDRVVLATGYRDLGTYGRTERFPPLLSGLSGALRYDTDTGLSVGFDYRVESDPMARHVPPIYLNGLCESTHGLGDAGSFSLLALRSQTIVASLRRQLGHDDGATGGAPADLIGIGPVGGSHA